MKKIELVEINDVISEDTPYWLEVIRLLDLKPEELLWVNPGHCYKYTNQKSLEEEKQTVTIIHYLEDDKQFRF